MTLETTGTVARWKVRDSTTDRNSASIGSMSGGGRRAETFSRRLLAKRAATASASAASPEITTESGPLTAAMPVRSVSSGRTSSSVARTGEHGAALWAAPA